MNTMQLNSSDTFLLKEISKVIDSYQLGQLTPGALIKRIEECGENIVSESLKKSILKNWWKMEIAYASFIDKQTLPEHDNKVIQDSLENIKKILSNNLPPPEDEYAWPFPEN